jgi:hypothetical protein
MTPELLTFVLWKWKPLNLWRLPYEAAHVNAMVRQLLCYISTPFEVVVVTDDPKGIDLDVAHGKYFKGIRIVPLWDHGAVKVRDREPNCYKRLYAFSDEAITLLGRRIISFDLDAVILADITDLFLRPEDFVINRGQVCDYNGAMWMLRTGTRRQAWYDFDPATSPAWAQTQKNRDGSPPHGSDQKWLSAKLKGEATWGNEHGVYSIIEWRDKGAKPTNPRLVFYHGRVKPWMPESIKTSREFFEHYQQFLEPQQRFKNVELGF